MSTFGNCGAPTGTSALPFGYPTFIRAAKIICPAHAIISKVAVYMGVSANPACTESVAKALLYNDAGGYPAALVAISQPATRLKITGEGWQDFSFTPNIEIAAGDYWIGLMGTNACGMWQDIEFTGGTTKTKTTGGGDWYDNPPNPFPDAALESYYETWNCITYEIYTNAYPVGWLKKELVSGFHCFMSAYILARLNDYDPLKLPDGTLF